MPLPNLAKDKYGIGDPKATKRKAIEKQIAASTAASKKANSPLEIVKQTILGMPRAAVDVGKDVLKGAAEFAVSAGEAPARLASPKLSTAVLPPANIPGLSRVIGPVQSFESKAAQKVQDGKTPLRASLEGVGETVINDPLGMAVKPLAVGGGLLLRQAAKSGAKFDLGMITRIIRGGKQAVTEATPAVRADAEFAGKTLPERLAATGERKVPVYGDTTPRRIPVAGISKIERVPIANDYRATAEDIQVGAPGRSDIPSIRSNKPLPVQETVETRINKLSPEDRKVVMHDTRQLHGRGLDFKAAQTRAIDAFEARSKPGDITFEALPEAPTAPARPAAPESVPVAQKTGEVPVAPVSEPVKAPVSRETAPISTETRAKMPEIEGEASIPKAANDINRKLAEKGFEEVPEEELAKFSSITKEDQIERVSRLMSADENAVKLMASRKMPIPEGVHPQVLFNAVKKKAIEQGDVTTMRELARSPIATERAEAAQTLGAAGFDNAIDDPIAAIASVAKVREKAAAKRGIKATEVKKGVAEAKAAITKAPKEDWNSFVDSITC